mmetsp:Transcript_2488/g.9755  ORF Transcript_2488/g.9755 Transcript_2488/m.9755 type:complete len:540 (-) Transcript_2488:1409-3028(-)
MPGGDTARDPCAGGSGKRFRNNSLCRGLRGKKSTRPPRQCFRTPPGERRDALPRVARLGVVLATDCPPSRIARSRCARTVRLATRGVRRERNLVAAAFRSAGFREPTRRVPGSTPVRRAFARLHAFAELAREWSANAHRTGRPLESSRRVVRRRRREGLRRGCRCRTDAVPDGIRRRVREGQLLPARHVRVRVRRGGVPVARRERRSSEAGGDHQQARGASDVPHLGPFASAGRLALGGDQRQGKRAHPVLRVWVRGAGDRVRHRASAHETRGPEPRTHKRLDRPGVPAHDHRHGRRVDERVGRERRRRHLPRRLQQPRRRRRRASAHFLLPGIRRRRRHSSGPRVWRPGREREQAGVRRAAPRAGGDDDPRVADVRRERRDETGQGEAETRQRRNHFKHRVQHLLQHVSVRVRGFGERGHGVGLGAVRFAGGVQGVRVRRRASRRLGEKRRRRRDVHGFAENARLRFAAHQGALRRITRLGVVLLARACVPPAADVRRLSARPETPGVRGTGGGGRVHRARRPRVGARKAKRNASGDF